MTVNPWHCQQCPPVKRVPTANKFHLSDADLHYQSLFLSPEHSNKNLRCVINHISLDGPREAAIVINFAGIGTRNVGIDALVGLFAFVALLGFLFLMLAWSVIFSSEGLVFGEQIYHLNVARALNGLELLALHCCRVYGCTRLALLRVIRKRLACVMSH